ncbi:retrotransposon protein, putative, ty1-copia subclass [Tanacetum coccineum]
MSVSKLLSLEDEELLGHTGTPRLCIPKKAETPAVLSIQEGKIQKDKKKLRGAKGKDKGKNKLAYAPKPKIPLSPKRDNPAKDSVCHHCKEVGHWRRNCSSYQAELKKRKNASVASTSDNVFYFNAIPRDGIYEIDMHNLYPNVSSMFNVSNKRAKHALDSSYLWHCRLGRINKKHMDMPQRDGILQPTHDELLEKCKSCISGKMARKPFPHQVERANDLFGLIHTDVCGPFRTVSREGASYFITFTDDFSRYGYVYLMKHKHEVFETFNVLIHDFTSRYTPQHNGVSERRNRTLLDMVRSMMNLTTLLKSFWEYALESTTRILNMVPTKKVERTLYEIWNEKAPNLSYLRVWGCEALVKRDAPDKLDPRSIKSARIPQARDRYGFYVVVEEYELGDLNEPPNYKVALSNTEFDKWLKAMNTKMQYMKDNQVWVLVDLPPNGRTIRSKWLFKKKTDMDGKVHTFKARLVAKGYT